jgi:hypothetical protein
MKEEIWWEDYKTDDYWFRLKKTDEWTSEYNDFPRTRETEKERQLREKSIKRDQRIIQILEK